jgi:serine/threonine protein kinase
VYQQVDGSPLDSVSTQFDVKIGDFDNCDGVQGTAFWRAPELLQAVKNRMKPIFSPAVDVYSYAMLCYELLTGQIPLEGYRKGDYDLVLSGQRPELPAHMNDAVKELLHACWRAEPGERPGWTCIIQTLKEELKLHPLVSHQYNSCASISDYSNSLPISANKYSTLDWLAIEHAVGLRSCRVPEISWEEAFARQLHNREEEKQFRTWKKKMLPELLPKIVPIVYNTFHDWHFESSIAIITWQILNEMYLNWKTKMMASKVR